MHFLIMKERKRMIDFKIEHKDNITIYLFGSAVYSENPSDIDIAIVYEKSKVNLEEIIRYRRELEAILSKQTNCIIETILLSSEEEKEMQFLANAKHKVI